MSLKGLIEFSTKEQIRQLKKQRDEETKKEILRFIIENKRVSFRELSDNLEYAKVFISKALFELKEEGKIDTEYETRHKYDRTISVLIHFPSINNKEVR